MTTVVADVFAGRLSGVIALVPGLSHREIARLSRGGVSYQAVSKYAAGARANPLADPVRAICAVLGIDAGWLVFGSGSPPKPKAVRASVDRAREALRLAQEAEARRAKRRKRKDAA